MKKFCKLILFTMVIFVLAGLNLQAQTSDKLTLHAFGAWAYGNTDGNNYLEGNENGKRYQC